MNEPLSKLRRMVKKAKKWPLVYGHRPKDHPFFRLQVKLGKLFFRGELSTS